MAFHRIDTCRCLQLSPQNSDNLNQCLHSLSGSYGVPDVQVCFLWPVILYVHVLKVFSSSVSGQSQNSNAF